MQIQTSGCRSQNRLTGATAAGTNRRISWYARITATSAKMMADRPKRFGLEL